MHAIKRSAIEAELPTSISRPTKRSMYAQTLPSRRNTYGVIIDDVPEGHSLLNRWIALFGETIRVLWERSADFASRIIPTDVEEIPEANIPLPESPVSHPKTCSRSPIPNFNTIPSQLGPSVFTPDSMSVDTICGASSSVATIPPLLPNNSPPTTGAEQQPRSKYPKHRHIHMSQHKRKVEEHNRKEMERLRTRRTSLAEEVDMEKTLLNAKKALAMEQGRQLAMQWQIEKTAGGYGSDLDAFAGLQTYRKMVLESAGKSSLESSPSLPDLSRSLSGEGRSRLVSQRRSSFNLQRTLQIAHQSLNEQHPLLPVSFEKLRISGLRRDWEIDRRIREATRLPTKFPPHVVQEIKLLRSKRGVISKFAREQVSDGDLARLDPSGHVHWLNDELINFYGALILDRAKTYAANKENIVNGTGKKRKGKAPEYLNVHYFSTFFWPKIEKGYKDGRLNKWTKRVDIFQQDIVLIPVNHGNVHWTLAAINFRKKRIESYDSMGIYRNDVYKTLRIYLDEEHRDKKKKPFDFTDWVDHFDENTPQQENGYDCGVFTCQFMESLSRGVDDFVFDQSDMPYIRNRMTYEIGRARLWDESDM